MNKYKVKDFVDDYGDGIHGTPMYDKNGEYYFINGNNLINGKVKIYDVQQRITEDVYKIIKRPLTENTILMSINGSLGKVAMYNNEKIALGKSVCYLNVKPMYNKYFLKYIFDTKEFNKYINLVAHGSTIKNLAPSQVVNYQFDAPDVKIQDKIAQILNCLENKIDINNKIISESKKLIKIIYNYWFIQFEFPNKESNPYKSSNGEMIYNEKLRKDIPIGWEYKKISEIEENIITGKTPSTKKTENFNGKIPFITIDDIRQGLYINKTIRTLSNKGANSQKNKYIPKDSICVTCIATVGLIGITTKESQTNQQINSIVCNNKNNLFYLVNALSDYFNYSNGAKSGNIFDNMNKDDFSSIKIIYPTSDILAKYNEKVMPIYEKIKYNVLENEELTNLKNYLLPLLMNGQVSFKD